MSETEYTYRRLDDSNRADLAYLYLDAFNENRPPVYTQKKFDTACFSVNDLAYFAYDTENKPAAFYALFPAHIMYNGNKILAAQVGDLMTHSSHRRKGLYLKLAHICHEQAVKEGVKLIFTIPYGENASYQGFINHLGFKKIYTMNEYIIKSPSLPMASLAEKIPMLKPVYSLYSSLALKTMHHLSAFSESLVYRAGVNEILKDSTFFNYKKYSTTYIVSLSGIEVWFKFKRSIIMVGDVRNLTESNVGVLMSGLKKICFLLGVRAVQFDVAPGSQVDVVLSSVTKPAAHYFNALVKTLTGEPFEDIYFTSGDLDNF